MGENLKVLMSDERMAVLTKEIDDWAAKKAEEDSVEVSKLSSVDFLCKGARKRSERRNPAIPAGC